MGRPEDHAPLRKPELEVVAAIFVRKGRILALQRGESRHAYLAFNHEFPGGKVQSGETREAALMRELEEEMDLLVEVGEENRFMEVRHTYPDFAVHLTTYLLEVDDLPFTLREHVRMRWLLPEALCTVQWHEGNREVLEALAEKYRVAHG